MTACGSKCSSKAPTEVGRPSKSGETQTNVEQPSASHSQSHWSDPSAMQRDLMTLQPELVILDCHGTKEGCLLLALRASNQEEELASCLVILGKTE